MAAEPSHLWRHNFIFLSWIVVQMMLKKFQIFHMQRSTWRIFTGILLHWWRHEKSAVFPIGSSLQCMKRKIFPLHRFRDTEVQNLSFFSRWCPYHVTYDVTIINQVCYQKRYIPWWKFCVDQTYRSWENDF